MLCDVPGFSKIPLDIAVYPILRDRVVNPLPQENFALIRREGSRERVAER
jgi:hypothetical protein